MKALIKEAPGLGAALKDTADPKPLKDEVILKVHRASICGSDMPIYNWSSWAPERVKPPLVFGHELCGEVVEVSPNSSFKPGDRVAVESHIYCGECAPCRAGDKHLCHRMKIVGIDRPGGFAQFVNLPERVLWKLEDSKLYDYASMLEPLGNAVYSTLVEPIEGKTVLVMGCGPQGLFCIQVAKAMGAKKIVALEKNALRSQLALKFGAHKVFGDAAKTEEILDGLEGYDVCLEMSGAPSLFHLGLNLLRNGGRMSLFGLLPRSVDLNITQDVIFKGLSLYGIMGRRIFQTWEEMNKLLNRGAIDLPGTVTHTFSLDQYKQAFELMQADDKSCGKILFKL